MSLTDIGRDLGKKIATVGLVVALGATSVLGAPVQSYDATTPTTTKYEQVVEQQQKPSVLDTVVQTEYEKPSLDGYDYVGSMPYDADDDGVKESSLTMYKNSQGDKIFKTKTNGEVWTWAKKSHNYSQDKNDITKNYAIVDSDCDGVFDTKYDTTTNIDFPSCLKK